MFRPFASKVYRGLIKILFSFRCLSARWRREPDFIIIGAQKCGTTSLYRNLVKHPQILESFTKEVHYFDLNYQKNYAWYKAHFPLQLWHWIKDLFSGSKSITGEASPYYIYHPHAARRTAQAIPHVKLIVILRNPVDRAYSEYQHQRRVNFEPEASFEKAIEMEKQRLGGELEKLLEDESYRSYEHQRHSYVSRGLYARQLKEWFSCFPMNQFLILKSEDFFTEPESVFRKICRFLDIAEWAPEQTRKYHAGNYQGLSEEERKKLESFFSSHNEELYTLIKEDFKWAE